LACELEESGQTEVIPLALVLALGLTGLALAFVVGRSELGRGGHAATLSRIQAALERASVSLLGHAATRVLLGLAATAALLVAVSLSFGDSVNTVPPALRAAFLCLALACGACSAFAQARLTLFLGTRASAAAAASAAKGSGRTARPLLRASVALAVFGEGLGLAVAALLFGGLYAVGGGFALNEGTAELARSIAALLPAFPLGAALAATALSREGSVLGAATGVGSAQAAERDAQLEHHDPRSPGTLAELLGTHVGGLMPRALASLVTGMAATVAVTVLATRAGNESGAVLVELLLLIKAFGLIASGAGVFAAQSRDDEAPVHALLRGHASALVVAAFGAGAACFWIARETLAELLLASSLGLLSVAVSVQLAWLPLRRSSRAARELADARAVGEGAAVARSSSTGFLSLATLLIPALALAALDHVTPAPARSLALTAFAASVLSTTPFALSVAGFGVLAGSAQGMAALARLEGDPGRRGARLEEAGALGSAAAATQVAIALATSLLLGLSAVFPAPGAAVSSSAALVAGLAGLCCVLTFSAWVCQSAVIGAKQIAVEIEQQLRGFARQQGAVSVPFDHTPSYKACVDVALAAARRRSALELVALVLVPCALLTGLHASGNIALPAVWLTQFALSAVVSGVVLSLGARFTGLALTELRRRTRGTESSSAQASAVSCHAFAEIVGGSAATSLEALVCAIALTALTLAPFFG
jgi:hypothetical protein